MPRIRDLGLTIGHLPTGATNSVLDVAGVGVGHTTIWRDEAAPPQGRGSARTGVTVLMVAEDAFERPVPMGGAILNGAGECTGFIAGREWGLTETPIYLTSTMQLGRVYDAACRIAIQHDEAVRDNVVIPVVTECDDSFLSEAGCIQIDFDDVVAAWQAALDSRGASQPPAEGAVGSGTGMSCFDFKAGIGTASRVTEEGHTVGVLVMANYGTREQCIVGGVPIGRTLIDRHGAPTSGPNAPAGSCIGVVLTDAPIDSAACTRLARRIGLGLGRTGSCGHHGSGEIFLGFGLGMRLDRQHRPNRSVLGGYALDPLFAATVEAAEEAVLNSMFQAPTVTGRDGHTSKTIDTPEVRALLGVS